MRLVVGLGNPGSEYERTRHNIGWEVVDRLTVRLGWIARESEFNRLARAKFHGLVIDGMSGHEKLVLLKPTTFMNLSGKSVQSAMSFYQLTPANVMIVLDDLALPCGKLRIRPNGSSGGHNGLKDIERVLGSNEYPRLRIGIDPPTPPMTGKDYVLGKFSPEQRLKIDPAVDRAVNAIKTWIEDGITAAMNRFNAESPLPPGEG
jgi:PTH1 family peptidyl-tRNA hydrolase